MLDRTSCAALTALVICGCADTSKNSGPAATTGEAVLAGTRLSEEEVAGYLRDAGFDESVVPQMVCTAKWESSFYSGATNRNRNGSTDYGLFQINDRSWLDSCGVNGDDLLDPATNTACALVVYQSQGLGAWYGYKAHRSECDGYHAIGGGSHGGPAGSDGASSGDPAGGDPSSGDGPGSTCWSPTLGDAVADGACVQSASNEVWYQCQAGQWERGVDEDTEEGPAGACSEWDPL